MVNLSDVEKSPFLLLITDEYPEVIQDYWQARGCVPDIQFRTNSFEAIRSLVAQGKGVTILSDLVYRPWSLEGFGLCAEQSTTVLPIWMLAL